MARRWPLALLALGFLIALLLVLAAPWAQSGNVMIGAPSPRDFTALRDQRYASELRSSAERERAAAAVPPAYRLDMALEAAQRQRAGLVLANISLLRQSPETLDQKLAWLNGFSEFAVLSAEVLHQLAEVSAPGALKPEDWDLLAQEVPRVVGQVMRQDIRSEDLTAVRREIGAIVDPRLDARTARLAGDVAASFVVPNRIPDNEAIAARQLQARSAAEAVEVQVQAGSTIVRKGDLVTPESLRPSAPWGCCLGTFTGNSCSAWPSLLALIAVLGRPCTI